MLNLSLNTGPNVDTPVGVRSDLTWWRSASASDHGPTTETRRTAFASLTGFSFPPCSSCRTFSFSNGSKEPPFLTQKKIKTRTLLFCCIFPAFVPFLVFVAQHFVTLVWKSAVVNMSASVPFCPQMCNSSACAYQMRDQMSGLDAGRGTNAQQ